MEPYESITESVATGRAGKTTVAFFDLDGTIIATHSVKDVFKERLFSGKVDKTEAMDMASIMFGYLLKSADFEDSLRSSIGNMRGMPEAEFVEVMDKVGRERLLPQIFPEIRAIVEAHRRKRHTLAIVTSASRYQAEPVARELGIEHILCTELKVENGTFTGELDGPPCYGSAKLKAAKTFAKKHRANLANGYFYSNGSEDLPLLGAVGHPVAICPDKRLKKVADRRNWTVHEFDSRGSPGPGDMARTLATFGSALPTFLAALPLRLFGGSASDSTNLAIGTWANLASIIAGLKLLVEGKEHLWSHRPAVFLFNHQSAMDMLITSKLLQEDVIGVAKKEILKQPLIGPVMKLAGTVFVDRDNVKDPKSALQPAVDAIREGKSVAIAPEGTRSKNGSLGKFKTGAFHLARQAGVPIVPIVIHNALDALPNKSMIVRPAEVKVTVLKPVETADWTVRNVAPEARRMRQAYLDVLGQDDSLDETAH